MKTQPAVNKNVACTLSILMFSDLVVILFLSVMNILQCIVRNQFSLFLIIYVYENVEIRT